MQEIMQSIVFVAAAILHGITGMGFPMLGTTALAFNMPLSKVVAFGGITKPVNELVGSMQQ